MRAALHLLAIACMETAVALTGETRTELERRLAALVPPKNSDEALSLASAGELALPFLVANKGQSDTVAAACIRTLAHIGGPEALDQIVAYSTGPSDTVREELYRAEERFEHEAYARRVFSLIHPETELHVSQAATLKVLRYYVNLTTLNWDGTQVSDLSALSSLTNLDLQ